jgi:hypothetical protein
MYACTQVTAELGTKMTSKYSARDRHRNVPYKAGVFRPIPSLPTPEQLSWPQSKHLEPCL